MYAMNLEYIHMHIYVYTDRQSYINTYVLQDFIFYPQVCCSSPCGFKSTLSSLFSDSVVPDEVIDAIFLS